VPTDRELVAAYLDGVSELAPDERRRVEALLEAEPALRDEAGATKSLIAELRALPDEGTAPDWAALERSIRDAVGGAVPRAPSLSFRRWMWWLAPIGAVAAAAAIVLVLIHHPHETVRARAIDGGVAAVPAPHVDDPAATAVWLDGHVVELGDIDDPAVLLDDDDGDEVAGGLLPADDLRWIDSLDDKDIDRAERWLAGKKG
jgi:anti-sigma factor RsiW